MTTRVGKTRSNPQPLFANNRQATVGAWGENKLLAEIRRWLGPTSPPSPHGMGDDCAVLPSTDTPQLVTVDPVIYDRHFDATVPAHEVGAKLLKRNLSDLAAMGGSPTAAVIALALDPRTSAPWLRDFYRGLARAARLYKVYIVGGDVAEAPGVFVATLTLLGRATGPRVLTRAGARRGDAIYVTGLLGATRGSGHHFRFKPRLEEGAWLARCPEVRAMLDISDGLAKDILSLTPTGLQPALEADSLPLRRGASVHAALTDGEDFELAIVFAADTDHAALAKRWKKRFPRVPLTRIGRFVSRGKYPPGTINLADYRGYEHLR